MELAGLCDRVLVFSRGRIVRELVGTEISEERIVSSFLTARDSGGKASAEVAGPKDAPLLSFTRLSKLVTEKSGAWWAPLAFLVLLTLAVCAYAAFESDVFLTPLNIRHILLATAPLAIVTMAQFNVLMVRGFDISVGALMSLTVVIASFIIAEGMGGGALFIGVIACLALGALVGLINGGMVRFAGINAVITTIATLSVLQGFALYGRPSPLGSISTGFIDMLQTRVGFLPLSTFVILGVAIAGDVWLYNTRSGLRLRAVGFREEAAKRNGVRLNLVHLRAYLLSALLAVVAGFFLSSEVGFGHPTVGSSYTLTSIAAAVLGGASLAGGRGSFVGAILGALFFTIIVNIITLIGLSTAVGIIASGALTLFAVFLHSGWAPLRSILAQVRAAFRSSHGAGRAS